MMRIFIIQVHDPVIHLEVDEEQWAITQGSKRQARWVWSPHTMSGLRLPDTPHAQHQHNDPRVKTGNKRRSIYLLIKRLHHPKGKEFGTPHVLQ